MTRLESFYPLSGAWKSFRDGRLAGEDALGIVLLVTADGTLSDGNTALRNILVGEGYSVIVRSLSAEEDYDGIDVVVMSYGNPQQDNGKYVNPPVGVVALDSWRAVGMGTTLGYTDGTTGAAEVIDAASDLAAGVTGTFNAYLSAAFITYERDLSGSPDVVVVRPDDSGAAVVFAYEAGSTMPGRFATTRHVALGYHQDGLAQGLTAAARSQVLAAVSWAGNSAFVASPPPPTPSSLSATGGDSRVTLSWSASSGADTYNAKRALVTGGPYSTIQTGVTSTGYVDATVTNDTPYFYVVSAENAQGESGNSPEATATPTVSTPSENLSLLVTEGEVAMWRDRAANGPYRTVGDVAPNSPGHWDEMVVSSTSNFASWRWSGPTVLQPLDKDDPDYGRLRKGTTENDPPGSVKEGALDLHDAAIVAIVNDDTALAQSVIDEIAWYPTQTNLDFSNRTLYPLDWFFDINPLFMIAMWVVWLAQAYSAATVLGTPNSTVESWFNSLAELCDNSLRSLDNQFPNRANDDYTSRSAFVDSSTVASSLRADASIIYHPSIAKYYNNRRNDMAGFAGLSGLITGNTSHVSWAKRYIREWMMFAARTTSAQETFGDHNRGTNSFPQRGISYDLSSLSRMIPFMEALARQGDTSLYDFSSSEGSAIPTWGTNHAKTMKEVIGQRIGWINGTVPAQYTNTGEPPPSSIAGDNFFRIKSQRLDPVDKTTVIHEIATDGWLIAAANYYNEPTWVDVVNRQGTPSGFTTLPNPDGPVDGWRVGARARFLRSPEANPHGS